MNLRARVRAGDPDAFGQLFDEYARAVYNHAYRLTGNWSAAEEVVSLTFLEAWRRRHKVEPEGGPLRPWLLGIAVNVTRNFSRATRRHRAAMDRLPPADTAPDFADDQSPDQEAFTTIGDLLRESVAPPRVGAALYRAAALIPGVTVVHDAVNAIGRHGVAVAFTDRHRDRSEWIFDKNTLQMIGERDVSLPSGRITGTTAVLNRAVVDRPGQVPNDQ